MTQLASWKPSRNPARNHSDNNSNRVPSRPGWMRLYVIGCHRAPCRKADGLKTREPASCAAAEEKANPPITSAKYAARLTRIRRRVAPLKSGKASMLEPNLAIANNRVNAPVGRCHDVCAIAGTMYPAVAQNLQQRLLQSLHLLTTKAYGRILQGKPKTVSFKVDVRPRPAWGS